MKIDAKAVKELRQKSGAGMMDAKKALLQCGGDVDEAMDYLRKKGLASADKKAGRLASEGAIGAYIHAGSRCVWVPAGRLLGCPCLQGLRRGSDPMLRPCGTCGTKFILVAA